MDTHEYTIKGSLNGMTKILRQEFEMSDDEARYFVYVMTNRYNENEVNTVDKQELEMWYLSDEDKYEGKILNTHLTINFTMVEKKVYHKTYKFLTKYIFSREIDLITIGLDLIGVLISAIKRIDDTDYCVFSRIIELCIENKEKLFCMSDIQIQNKDGKCDYQEDDWKCTYWGQDGNCTCNEDKVRLAFLSLERNNVIKKVGERWMLVK